MSRRLVGCCAEKEEYKNMTVDDGKNEKLKRHWRPPKNLLGTSLNDHCTFE